MPDIIHLLPDQVANQIAAGEVVLQASSVIKELVENAVDAGACHIDVRVIDSGKTLIQVIDDGKGMSETDARMAFERHATSKITQAEDVYNLHTMGFRGEALPSIAAVAHVTLRTRQHDQQLGTKICIEGGKVISQEKDMCPAGTSFSVSNLFFNMTARRSHLVNHTSAEYRGITQEFERMALVNPSVSFSFYNNDVLVRELPASNVFQRITNLFGKRLGADLLPVEVKVHLCEICGFVGTPKSARKKGALQYFFVNGRFMRHGFFHKAVCEAFADLIPEGEQVPYFLYFNVDPSTIDVNIHPAKTEIDFHNKTAIWPLIISGIKEALGKFNAVPTIIFDTEGAPEDIPVYNPDTRIRQTEPQVEVDTSFNPFASALSMATPTEIASPQRTGGGYAAASPTFAGGQASGMVLPSRNASFPSGADDEDFFGTGHLSDRHAEIPEGDVSHPGHCSGARESLQDMEKSNEYYQYRGQYILTAVRSGLMFIDQHRAHVRVLYNRYRTAMEGQTAATQGLLFPEMLTLSLSDEALMENIMPDLANLGFDLSPLGGGSYSVLGVPSSLGEFPPVSLLKEIVDSVRDSGKSAREDVQHRMALSMARRAALCVGEVLTRQQMEALVGDLFATDAPSYGPDGKTILTIMPQDNIEKLFR